MSGVQSLHMQLATKERERLVEKVRSFVARLPEVVFAYLYGSFVESEKFRDIDVAVFLEQDYLRSVDVFDYELEKSTALSIELRRDIDVKVINTKPPGLQYNATAGQLLFARDDDVRTDFAVKARSMYFDFQIASRKYFEDMTFSKP